MNKNKKPLAAGQADQQGASFNYNKDTPHFPLSQGEVSQGNSAKSGYRIDTVWVSEAISPGKPMHRVAFYVLQKKHPVQMSLLDQVEGVDK